MVGDTGYDWTEYFKAHTKAELRIILAKWKDSWGHCKAGSPSCADFANRVRKLQEYLRPKKYTDDDVLEILAELDIENASIWQVERQTFHFGAEVLPVLRKGAPSDGPLLQNLFAIDVFVEPDFPGHYWELRQGTRVLLTGFISSTQLYRGE